MFYSTFYRSRNSTLTKLSHRLLATLGLNPMPQHQYQHQQSLRKFSEKVKEGELFNTPRPPKDPPDDYKPTKFNHKAFDAPHYMPCSIFRQFSSPDEKLGPNASKDAKYKNPEYYAYHRFTFVEMQKNVLEIRQERICNDNAKCIYDYESDDEVEKSKDGDSCAGTDDKKTKVDGEKGKAGVGSKNQSKAKGDKAPPSSTKK